ncbi:hypothetical protein GCM10020331_028170 [Ectobacillus funiculus]
MLVYGDDRAGTLLWSILTPTLLYAAKLNKEIADHIVAIDQAMKWGFGWEMGPFETWDAIGVRQSVEKMREKGLTIPVWVQEMLENGFETFYKHDNGFVYYYEDGAYRLLEQNKKAISLRQIKEQGRVLKKKTAAGA